MKKIRFTEEQKAFSLRQPASGAGAKEIIRKQAIAYIEQLKNK